MSFVADADPGSTGELRFAVQYGDGDDYFTVVHVTVTAAAAGSPQEVQWPDVAEHETWRLLAVGDGQGWRCRNVRFYTRHWGVQLTEPSQHGRLTTATLRALPMPARALAAQGALFEGGCELLSQLYHESDLLSWGSGIPFPCFMTLWAKERAPADFATLVHRFERRRGRPPVLVMSGTSVEERQRLWDWLRPLLRPEWEARVAASASRVRTPEDLVELLWRLKASGVNEPPPSLDDINERIAAAYDRLQVPAHMRADGYACQFSRRDPLMLLLTKETFGTWAPNRVFNEIEGYDIFRTYAEFTCVDGVICADDAVWLHKPCDFYKPAPDRAMGDKRTPELFALLEKQRPFIQHLLDDYVRHGRITPEFRTGLESGFLSPPTS